MAAAERCAGAEEPRPGLPSGCSRNSAMARATAVGLGQVVAALSR